MLATLTPLLLIAGLALAVPPGWRDRPGLKRVLEPLIATALAAATFRLSTPCDMGMRTV